MTHIRTVKGSDKARVAHSRARRLACGALTLVATSAGLGALAQRELTLVGRKQPVVVVNQRGGVGNETVKPPVPACDANEAGTSRDVLVGIQLPTRPCPSPVVLD